MAHANLSLSLDAVARKILDDFLRGKLPWFSPPPAGDGEHGKGVEGRAGRLGEMPRKRKRDDAESMPDTSMGAPTPEAGSPKADDDDDEVEGDDDEDEFSGFGSDSAPSLDGELEDGESAPEDDEEAPDNAESADQADDDVVAPEPPAKTTKSALRSSPGRPKKRKSGR